MHSSEEHQPKQQAPPRDTNRSESASNEASHEAHSDIASKELDGDAVVEIVKEDLAAARALMELREDSIFTIRRFVNKHNRNLGAAVKTILQQGIQFPLCAVKTAVEVERDARISMKNQELDAALTLIKLSGQSRADSRVALALLRLRQECMVYLAQQQRKELSLAQRALGEQKAAERFLALKKFHQQYPAVLRTSRRMDRQSTNTTESSLLQR